MSRNSVWARLLHHGVSMRSVARGKSQKNAPWCDDTMLMTTTGEHDDFRFNPASHVRLVVLAPSFVPVE